MINEANPSLHTNAAAPGIADWTLEHPTLTQQIGHPAVLAPGAIPPAVRIHAYADIQLTVELENSTDSRILQSVQEVSIAAGHEQLITFTSTPLDNGLYIIRIRLNPADSAPLYDNFTFMVMDTESLSSEQSHIAYLDTNGSMTYVPDYKGNRIADFSNCGYKGGGVTIPNVPVRLTLSPASGESDDTARIQQAIDELSCLPIGEDGFRGALLLQRGIYRIAGTLYIRESGVVLRGEGQGEDGTILHGTGTAKRDLVEVLGSSPDLLEETGTDITDLYVPSGSRVFHVADASGYSVGDTVAVLRYGNASWISEIDMDTITPRPNAGGTKQWAPFELLFDRVITGIEDNVITIDAPITNAIEARWGGGKLFQYDDKGRIEQVGLENLRIDSDFNPEVTDTQVDGRPGSTTYCADESHTVNFATLNFVKNAWVRDVTGYHLEHSLVTIDRYAKWVTIQDCTVRDMVSIITGGRRYCFHVTGQLSLVQRCDTETARHAFVFDAKVSGPNVFLDSESRIDFNASEPHHRWSVGGLYDNVQSPIYIRDRGWMGSGHGWAGANYVTWNTEGVLTVQQPPTAQNYAIGHIGKQERPFLPNQHDLRPRQDGFWDRYGQHVEPRSLYLQQLKERLGDSALENIAKTPETK
ncbi:hypothetical protein [Paenibacillus sp. UNC451MF]|uniref:hypothetical protein n=1 Tax=Paenibacillus sp. UNC451MF TaxID=1449063 RepID=UPI000689DF2B|nr:hypothetical protein [Paenibacillus sp. UNC451MF]